MDEYKLPDLPYAYNALEPYIDEATMKLHHQKHHAGYVKGLNSALAKLKEAREKGDYGAIRALSLALAFHGSGHYFHSLFWKSMCPKEQSEEPTSGKLHEQMKKDFGSVENFKNQFAAASKAVEGSGWGVLAWEPLGKRLIVLQAENHQKQTLQGSVPILVLDVWEHAYYLKYQNRRAEFVDQFWNIVNWKEVEKRLEQASALNL
ncbi:superoxide dismutase [Candidatus Micrarchaeota archaeon]|nr:MAG: superoxide dismutase [Candidatus Micrarchaeota archaeon]